MTIIAAGFPTDYFLGDEDLPREPVIQPGPDGLLASLPFRVGTSRSASRTELHENALREQNVVYSNRPFKKKAQRGIMWSKGIYESAFRSTKLAPPQQ